MRRIATAISDAYWAARTFVHWEVAYAWFVATDWLLHPWRVTRRNERAVHEMFRLFREEQRAVRKEHAFIYKALHDLDKDQSDMGLLLVRVADEVGITSFGEAPIPERVHVDRIPDVQELEAMGVTFADNEGPEPALAGSVEHGFYAGTDIDPRY